MKRSHVRQQGTTTIEYALIITAVVLVMFVGLSQLGNSSTGLMGSVATQVDNNM